MTARGQTSLIKQVKRLVAEMKTRRGLARQEGDAETIRDCDRAIEIMEQLLETL